MESKQKSVVILCSNKLQTVVYVFLIFVLSLIQVEAVEKVPLTNLSDNQYGRIGFLGTARVRIILD